MSRALRAFGVKKTKVRKFDGENYRLHSDHFTLSQAEREATKLRSKGWKARIVKVLGLYAVYKRRK